ncbi:MAG: hypothetical protein ACK4UN_12025 [Limisphaerales bacterium]
MSGSETPFFPLVAQVEFLVILLLMAASAIYNWLQKKKEGQQDEWAEFEGRPTSTQQQKPSDWEEELRRLLEGETPKSQPPPLPPPPVIREHQRNVPTAPPVVHPQPAPLAPKAPVVKTHRALCEHCQGAIEFPANLMGDDIHCPHCYRQTRLYPHIETIAERRRHQAQVASTAPPMETISRGGLESATIAAHRMAVAQTRRDERPAEVQQVIAMFRQPRTARQAVIASVILNPPKALDS